MISLSFYGISCDVKSGWISNPQVSYIDTVKEIMLCIIFAIVFSIPAVCITFDSVSFFGRGFLSSIMSFGGGDAYLT